MAEEIWDLGQTSRTMIPTLFDNEFIYTLQISNFVEQKISSSLIFRFINQETLWNTNGHCQKYF